MYKLTATSLLASLEIVELCFNNTGFQLQFQLHVYIAFYQHNC